MRIFALGATGFVGQTLVPHLLRAGHEVTALVRRHSPFAPHPRLRTVAGDPLLPGAWQEEVAQHDAVINLTGASIAGRWDSATKERIRSSRVRSTELVVEALQGAPAKVLVCANAVGYFGDCGDTILDDHAPAGTGFLAEVCIAWQEAAMAAAPAGHRVVIPRFGVVLGPGGGVLAKMLPVFRWGLGGRLGSGCQWFSWVHIQDLADALRFLLEQPGLTGPINVVAPEPVTSARFTATLAEVVGRPAFLPVPALVLRLAFGEAAAMLLASQRCIPRRLEEAGFQFSYPNLAGALRHAVHSTPTP